jgi:hypothetical protein
MSRLRITALLIALTLLSAVSAIAQDGPATARAAAPTKADPRMQPLAKIAESMSQSSGITVLAESTVALTTLLPLDTEVTSQNLESILERVIKRLPPGTTWARVYLATPTNNRRYSADAVAQLARAQAGLFGRSGTTAPNTVEIQGKKLSVAEAEPQLKALGLEPYYVLLGTKTSSSDAQKMASAMNGLSGTGAGQAMAGLLKQLGVSSVKDIPTGNYNVQFPRADGSLQDAVIGIENDGGNTRVNIKIGEKP